jgi:hypothetical protein
LAAKLGVFSTFFLPLIKKVMPARADVTKEEFFELLHPHVISFRLKFMISFPLI